MKNLSDKERREADVVLGAVFQTNTSLVESTVAKGHKEWLLPCHSIILSAISTPLAAGTLHAGSTLVEKTADGERIVRLPLNKAAAKRLLEYAYGILDYPEDLSLAETIQLANISNMQEIQGQALPYNNTLCCTTEDQQFTNVQSKKFNTKHLLLEPLSWLVVCETLYTLKKSIYGQVAFAVKGACLDRSWPLLEFLIVLIKSTKQSVKSDSLVWHMDDLQDCHRLHFQVLPRFATRDSSMKPTTPIPSLTCWRLQAIRLRVPVH